MNDKYCITYNNDVDDAFHVHTKNGVIRFVQDGRLYTYEPSEEYLRSIAEYENKNSTESAPYDDYVLLNRDGYTDAQLAAEKYSST